jgi:hypothetical protein
MLRQRQAHVPQRASESPGSIRDSGPAECFSAEPEAACLCQASADLTETRKVRLARRAVAKEAVKAKEMKI